MAAHIPRLGYRSLRQGRISQAGGVYLLTTVTHHRRRCFEDWSVASTACAIIHDRETWLPHASLLCWVLMPDHWHGLVQLEENGSLQAAMQRMKGIVARRVGHLIPTAKPLWFPGFHDRALRREDDMLAVARYIIANPIRAKLVRRVGDYPYWNAAWL
jgi:REP element-mobilizing transposase RayT